MKCEGFEKSGHHSLSVNILSWSKKFVKSQGVFGDRKRVGIWGVFRGNMVGKSHLFCAIILSTQNQGRIARRVS
jgi:hypothetical protein